MASCSISGWSGADRSYTLSVTEQSYNAKTNQSVVKWTLSAGGSGTWYDYYLYASVNGTKVYSESGSWSKGSFPASTGSTSGTMTITHNSDGRKSISFYIEGYAYQYSTKKNSGTLTLTNLDRTAPTITASDIFDIDVDKFKITLTSNVTCSQWAWRIKKGSGSYGGWTYATSSGTSHTFTISGLEMNTTYTVQGAGKKSSNDVWGYPLEKTAKTLGASWIDSVQNITLGENVEVKFTPLDSTFQYKIQFILGEWAGYTTDFIVPASLDQQTYNSYTVPITVANYITDSDSGTMTAVLFTYDEDGNQIGNANNATFSVAVPSSIVPTIDSVTLEEGETSGFNLFVKSLSSIKATVTASGAYSSTITSIAMSVEGNTYTANLTTGVAESNILSTCNETDGLPVVITIIDSRNRRATRTLTPKVYDYYLPSYEADAKVYQTTITTTVKGNIAPVNNTNQKRMTIVRRRVVDDVTETYTVNPLPTYSFTQQWLQTLADAGRETYEYTITIADKINSATITIQTGVTALSRHAGGRGITFFGEAKEDGFDIVDTTTGDYIGHQVISSEYLDIARQLAYTYSADETWEKGEFCVHEDNVYECKEDITTPESFNANHWLLLGTALDIGGSGHQGMGLLDYLHPVGEIFISIDANFNPNTAWGGVWEKLEDTFLVGAGNAYALGANGGEAQHTLTINEMPSHNHGQKTLSGYLYAYAWNDGSSGGIITKTTGAKNMSMSGGSSIGHIGYTVNATHTHDTNGEGVAHNNLPPYTAVFMWQRLS